VQTLEVVEIAAVHVGAHGHQRRDGPVRPGQAGDLVSSLEKLGHHCRPDVARRAGDKNSHDELPEVTMKR
jgi:hypothetical protein